MKNHQFSLKRKKPEEVVFFAGWIYAALFLTFMVVFMATVSFLPSNTAANIQQEKAASDSVFNQSLVVLYNSYDVVQVETDIQNFLQRNKLPERTPVISAQIIGGYDAQLEENFVGIERARALKDQLIANKLQRFNNAATSLGASSTIAKDQFVLKLFFAI